MEWNKIYKEIILKQTTDFNKASDLLKKYENSYLNVCFFHMSLGRLVLRLNNSDLDELVYIVLVACNNMCGKFQFPNAFLKLETSKNKYTTEKYKDNNDFKIFDTINKFEVNFDGGLILFIGKGEEFGENIENLVIFPENNDIPEI